MSTTKYTFSSIIKPFHYSRTYFKYNGTSLNRKKYQKKIGSSIVDIRRVEAQKEALHSICDTSEYTDFPRVKVFKTEKIGGRFKAPLVVPEIQPFQPISTEITKCIVDTITGETIPFSPLTVLTKNQVVYDYISEAKETSKDGQILLHGNENKTIGEVRTYTMSSRTRSKIKQKIHAWYYAKKSNRNLTFVTLTFVNEVDDKTGVKCLNNFLTWVRKNKQGFVYLWVAERQTNGRLHFHIICNKYLPVDYYNGYWVRCQANYGIVNTAAVSLNPMDIRHIKQLKTLIKYVTKYITKNTTSFDCALWNCSRSISALSTGYTSNDTFHNYISTNMPSYNSGVGTFPCLGEPSQKDYALVIPIFNKKICESYKDVHAFNYQVLSTTDLSTLKELAHTIYERPAQTFSNTISHSLIAEKLFEDLPRT